MKYALFAVTSLALSQVAVAEDFLSGFSLSEDSKPKEQMIQTKPSGSYFTFNVKGQLNEGTISISGPNGYFINKQFKQSVNSLRLNEYENMRSGRYFYQITAHVGTPKLIRDTINNGRGENNFTYAGDVVKKSGSFVVKNGSIKTFMQKEEGTSSGW